MKKILITGASGFFGKNLLHSFITKEEEFECFCVYNSQKINIIDKRFKWVKANLLDEQQSKKLIEEIKPTHCVHLAWHVPPQQFWSASENVSWLYGSIRLFQAFCENKGQMFIGAGTLAEYDWSSGILDEQITPLIPNTLYGQCKKSLYEILKVIRDTNYPEVNIIWPRIGYFFGPYESSQKLIPKLINSIKNDLPINLASAEFSRPYAHVKYFSEIISNILISDNSKNLDFNLSSSKSYALKEIVDFLAKNLNKDINNIKYDVYPSKPIDLLVKVDYLKILGFEIPNTFFEDLRSLW